MTDAVSMADTEAVAVDEVFRRRVEQRLEAFLADQHERLGELAGRLAPLFETATEAIAGGKRLRASFCYWGWRAAGGGDDADIVDAAAALEVMHASALVHDDVMDASDTRRGRPSAHRRFADLHEEGGAAARERFGMGAAILLGDLLLGWADELLYRSAVPPERVAEAARYFDAMRTEVAAGQYLDLVAQSSGRHSVPQAMRVVRYKAAKYTVERPLHIGAALAGADPVLVAALSSYGLPLGEAFQLRDDILGVYGDPAVTGKPAGDDLREGKRTVLVALTDERADGAQRSTMARLLGRADLDITGVEDLRHIIEATGARAAVESLIIELTEAATTSLRHAPIADPAVREALVSLAAAATRRNW